MKIRSEPLSAVEITQAMTSPTSIFDAPDEVVQRADLSRQQKIDILKRWELDARGLQRATDENMGGGEQPQLDEVNAALLALDPKDKTEDQFGNAPTKI